VKNMKKEKTKIVYSFIHWCV